MMEQDPLTLATAAGAGFCWIFVYILLIRRGFLDRTCGMPAVALVLNSTWELIYGFVHPSQTVPPWVVRAWFGIDLVLWYQYVRFGVPELRRLFPTMAVYLGLALTIFGAYKVELTIVHELGNLAEAYAGMGVNLVMSALFVNLVVTRGSAAGQSMYIGLLKLIGTVVIYVPGHATHPSSEVLPALHIACGVLDGAYLLLLYRQLRKEGLNPWRRL
jgi:hypothetical protein